MRKFLRVGASSVMTAPASGPSHGSGVAPALWYAKRHSSTRASRATAAALEPGAQPRRQPAVRDVHVVQHLDMIAHESDRDDEEVLARGGELGDDGARLGPEPWLWCGTGALVREAPFVD